MGRHGIGQPVRRKEDFRHLTGQACFTDDLSFDGQLYACFVRAPVAHAEIIDIDAGEALGMPGVEAVVTGASLSTADLGTLASEADIRDRSGGKMFRPARHVLPTDRVRFVGEPVAMVLAELSEDARTAAERVELRLRELPAVTGAADAIKPGAALLWPAHGSNVAVHWENHDAAEVEALLAAAPRRVSVEIVNNRLIPSPMEPRVALATYDAAEDRLVLYAPTQGGRRIQQRLAEDMLRMPAERVRVVSSDTGGAFGIRSKLYPEMILVAWAARELRRPIKWRADRSETFVSDYHGRDQINRAEMGLTEDGRVVALKVDTLVNVGAFLSDGGPRMAIQGGGKIIPCAYDIQKFHYSVRPVFTNTVPTDSYRGAGRPEANFIMERLMDLAAIECGLSRDEIRRRNLIRREQLPYRTRMGLEIDSGDFAGCMDKALAAADWGGFAERRARSEATGKLRGIGLACFLEGAGGRATEEMRVRVEWRRQCRCLRRHLFARAGARDGLRAAHRGISGRGLRQGAGRARRHGPHARGGGRHVRVTLLDDGGRGNQAGLRRDHRERAGHRGAATAGGYRRRPLRRRSFRERRQQRRHCRGGAGCRRPGRARRAGSRRAIC